MFKNIPPEIRKHIFLTSPLVALLLSIPLCIAYMADPEDYVRVTVTLILGVWATWMVVLLSSRWSFTSGRSRVARVAFNQCILFVLGLAIVYMLPILDLASIFTKGKILILVFTVSLTFNLVVETIHELVRSNEDWTLLHTENAALRYAKLQAEFQMLKEQINPHFLFNALNTSKSLVREDPAGAERYIIHLSDFLRSTIQHHEMMVTLAEEMAMCHNYMELQRIRFGKALQFRQAVDHERLRMRIPYFALTTLVENAIKHNALTSEHPVIVDILSANDEIMVVNNVRPKPGTATTGIGLTNLDERCRLLTGAPITVSNDGATYSVRIKLTPP